MKTSNILLFSIMSSFSVIIIAGAMELRLFGRLSSSSISSDMLKEVDAELQPFQVLVINESINVAIEKGDALSFQVFRDKFDSPPIVKFHQSQDTLFIDQVAFRKDGSSLHAAIKLKDTQALKTIIANHSTFSMKDFNSHSLDLKMDKSRMYVTSQLDHLQNLHVAAVNSYIFYNGGIQEKLEVDLDQSEVIINGDISSFSGSIKNNSDLLLHNVSQISFSKDSTSSIRIVD